MSAFANRAAEQPSAEELDRCSDEELLQAWRDGDSTAGEIFQARHYAFVLRFFRIKLERGVEKITNSTFTTLRDKPKLARGESIETQLMSIARSRLLLRLRRLLNQTQPGAKFDPTKNSVKGILQDDRTRISRRLARHQQEDMMLGTLRLIPSDLQIALELKYWEHWTDRDIATVLEVEESQVQSYINQAFAKIKGRVLLLAEDREFAASIIDNLVRWFISLRRVYAGKRR